MRWSRIPCFNSQTRTAARTNRFVRASVPIAACRGSNAQNDCCRRRTARIWTVFSSDRAPGSSFRFPQSIFGRSHVGVMHPFVTGRCNTGNNLVKSTEWRRPSCAKQTRPSITSPREIVVAKPPRLDCPLPDPMRARGPARERTKRSIRASGQLPRTGLDNLKRALIIVGGGYELSAATQ